MSHTIRERNLFCLTTCPLKRQRMLIIEGILVQFDYNLISELITSPS